MNPATQSQTCDHPLSVPDKLDDRECPPLPPPNAPPPPIPNDEPPLDPPRPPPLHPDEGAGAGKPGAIVEVGVPRLKVDEDVVPKVINLGFVRSPEWS